MTKRTETHEESASYSYTYIYIYTPIHVFFCVDGALKVVLLNFCVPFFTISSHHVLLEC